MVDLALDFDLNSLLVDGIPVFENVLEESLFGPLDLENLVSEANDTGTLDFGRLTLKDPPILRDIVSFDLVRVTFKARRATRGLSVGFHDDFLTRTRRTEASYRGIPVLDRAIGFTPELALELRLTTFDPLDVDGEVLVRARPNGRRIDAVDAFLNAIGNVEVNEVSPARGTRLEELLIDRVNDDLETVDFGATTIGDPPFGEFDIAIMDVTGVELGLGNIDFHTQFPRRTQAFFRTSPVKDLQLTGVDLVAVAPGQLPNLAKIFPNTDNTPQFEWDTPLVRPAAGIRTFTLAVSRILLPDNVLQNVDVRDPRVGSLLCFDAEGLVVECLIAGGAQFNVEQVAFVRYTLSDELTPDGDYRFTVKATDNLGQLGDDTSIIFRVDSTPPTVPGPTGPLAVDLAFTNDVAPLLQWDPSQDNLTPNFGAGVRCPDRLYAGLQQPHSPDNAGA